MAGCHPQQFGNYVVEILKLIRLENEFRADARAWIRAKCANASDRRASVARRSFGRELNRDTARAGVVARPRARTVGVLHQARSERPVEGRTDRAPRQRSSSSLRQCCSDRQRRSPTALPGLGQRIAYSVDDRLKGFCEKVSRQAQISLLVGPHFADIRNLVEYYLPKPALDYITGVSPS
jgi:hypothetical protein